MNMLLFKQLGVRKQYLTLQQVLGIVEYTYGGYKRNKVSDIVFIDFSKAFDRVWHESFVKKLDELRYLLPIVHTLEKETSKPE